MGWRGTLILALLVVVAGIAFLVSPKPPVEMDDSTLLGEPRYVAATTPSARLLDFDPAEVTGITLGYRDEVVTVARSGTSWRGAADARNLDDFLRSLHDVTIISTLEQQSPLSDYGLDAPARRVLLETAKGKPVVLLLGDRNPAGTSVYVRADDGPVVIAGALALWEFDKAFAAVTGRKSPL